jgi:hypothetical protein
MIVRRSWLAGGSVALVLAAGLGGCAKPKQSDPQEEQAARQQTKRHEAACASRIANDRVKSFLFDAARRLNRDRANLDTLEDYSSARMEEPTVAGWDQELDVTKCAARLILMLPPGAERGFANERQLQENIAYTAQPAADGSGLVYKVQGAEPIIDKLARFNLTSGAIRPPAAIDEPVDGSGLAEANGPSPATQQPHVLDPLPHAADVRSQPNTSERVAELGRRDVLQPPVRPRQAASPLNSSGEASIRAFYRSLEAGNGTAASAYIVPEKRSSRAFAPEAMTRFYGQLREPIRLTSVAPLAGGSYRVTYRYSAGRTRCSGSAIVSVVHGQQGDLIRSIRALNGC